MQERANEFSTEPSQRRWRWYLADASYHTYLKYFTFTLLYSTLLHRTNGTLPTDLGRLQVPKSHTPRRENKIIE